jgi:exopolysaccharide biosynthesis protein
MIKKILIDRVKVVDNRVISLSGKDWSRVIYAIGAGPNLITDGAINITDKEEELGPGGNDVTRRAGHTALGITKDNKLVLFSVDDRKSKSTESLGMNLKEIAEYLLKLNVTDAINMDGGDSTTMVIQGKLIAKPTALKEK